MNENAVLVLNNLGVRIIYTRHLNGPGTVPELLDTQHLAMPLSWGSPQIFALRRNGTRHIDLYTVRIWDLGHSGRGTPSPFEPPRLLVDRGPYRRVTNLFLCLGWLTTLR